MQKTVSYISQREGKNDDGWEFYQYKVFFVSFYSRVHEETIN